MGGLIAAVAVGPAHFPAWSPHPDVWLLVALIGAAYALAVTRLGPGSAPDPLHPVTRRQVTAFCLGLLTVWIASDWPVHDVAEKSLYSVHMAQHMAFTFVAAPLLLLGTPAWMARRILGPRWLFSTVRWMSRLFPAVVIYNLVLVLAHWPAVLDLTLENGLAHFFAHSVLLLSGLIVWMPVFSPLPEIPRLGPMLTMFYLFLESIVPTIPASFLTFGDSPLYKVYERLPHLYGFSTLGDQRIAGLEMKLGGGILIWMAIGIVFFRWASDEERKERDSSAKRPSRHAVDRELSQMELTNR
jgi:putative membrane protein